MASKPCNRTFKGAYTASMKAGVPICSECGFAVSVHVSVSRRKKDETVADYLLRVSKPSPLTAQQTLNEHFWEF